VATHNAAVTLDNLIADEVQLPWGAAIWGALAGAVAASPAAVVGLADENAARVAFFGPVFMAAYGGLLAYAAAISDRRLAAWPRPKRWGLAMFAASFVVLWWQVGEKLLRPTVRGGPAMGHDRLLHVGIWILVAALLSGVYGGVVGHAASRRMRALRVATLSGGLVVLAYVLIDALAGGPMREASEGAAMLATWGILAVTAGALLGAVLAWQLRRAARQPTPEAPLD
jgi:hypothetical protein